MCRLVSLLEAGERGQYADLQWFYYFMERSDAMIASVIQRRRAALLSVDWDIRLVAERRAEGEDLKPEIGIYNDADGVEPVPPGASGKGGEWVPCSRFKWVFGMNKGRRSAGLKNQPRGLLRL
jgi:hypothetical protein